MTWVHFFKILYKDKNHRITFQFFAQRQRQMAKGNGRTNRWGTDMTFGIELSNFLTYRRFIARTHAGRMGESASASRGDGDTHRETLQGLEIKCQ